MAMKTRGYGRLGIGGRGRVLLGCVMLALPLSAAPGYAQKSVRNATESAAKMLEKGDDKRIKDFNKKYAKAQAEIQSMLAAAGRDPMKYDAIADNALDWVAFGDALRKFPEKTVKGTKETAVFEQEDYMPVVVEARQKAAAAYFDEGRKVVELTREFSKRKKALSYLDKAMKYSDQYDEEVAELRRTVYREEADRLSGAASSGDLEKALEYYDAAQAGEDEKASVAARLAGALVAEADRSARLGDSYSLEAALKKYARAAELGDGEAGSKREALLDALHTVVVVNMPVVEAQTVDDLQDDLPEYVHVTVNNDARTPLGRLRGDIAIVAAGKERRGGDGKPTELSLEVYDLRYPAGAARRLASYPVKETTDKRKDPYNEALRQNRWEIARLIKNLKRIIR